MISVQCRCLSSFTKLKTRNPLKVFFFISSSVNSLSVQNSDTQEKLQVFYLTQNKKVSSALSNNTFWNGCPIHHFTPVECPSVKLASYCTKGTNNGVSAEMGHRGYLTASFSGIFHPKSWPTRKRVKGLNHLQVPNPGSDSLF